MTPVTETKDTHDGGQFMPTKASLSPNLHSHTLSPDNDLMTDDKVTTMANIL